MMIPRPNLPPVTVPPRCFDAPEDIAAEQVANWLATGFRTREAAAILGMRAYNPDWQSVYYATRLYVQRQQAGAAASQVAA